MSYAGSTYNIGRAWAGRRVEVFTLDGMVYFASGGAIVRTLPAKDLSKKRTAIADPRGGRRAAC